MEVAAEILHLLLHSYKTFVYFFGVACTRITELVHEEQGNCHLYEIKSWKMPDGGF